jgi:GNAT superfamily N-acetyltransferase
MGGQGNSETLRTEIRKIRLSELESFIQSDSFGQLAYIPITPARAMSYIKNPYGLPDDVVLIMAFTDGQLVAFRSLFAGIVQKEMERIRFGWCSGNWVHPQYRKKGLSQLLLKEAYSDWNGRLMFTNYAPESENLYLKTGWFHEIHRYDGVRAYLFLKKGRLMNLMKNKAVPSPVVSLVSHSIDLIARVRVYLSGRIVDSNLQFKELEYPDSTCFRFLHDNPRNFLFVRNEDDWNWIFGYSWIKDNISEIKKRYPFSSVSGDFYYRTIKVLQNGVMTGFFIVSVREGHLKTLFFLLKPGLEKDVSGYICLFAAREKLEMATVYHSGVASYLLKNKSPFLYVKKFGQKIYSTFETGISASHVIRDSDGDYVFT